MATDDLLCLAGIQATTGDYLVPKLTVPEAAALIRGASSKTSTVPHTQAEQPDPEMAARVARHEREPLLPRHLRALFSVRPDLIVLNTYGTTETTGFNTINRLTASNYTDFCEAGAVAIGEDDSIQARGWCREESFGGGANSMARQ